MFVSPVQENAYWSMNMSYYKCEHSNFESTCYHSYETGNSHVLRPDFTERPWVYSVPMNVDQGVSTDVIYEENTVPAEDAATEECEFEFSFFFLMQIPNLLWLSFCFFILFLLSLCEIGP